MSPHLRGEKEKSDHIEGRSRVVPEIVYSPNLVMTSVLHKSPLNLAKRVLAVDDRVGDKLPHPQSMKVGVVRRANGKRLMQTKIHF